MERSEAYRLALTDWMACALAGRTQPAAEAARRAGDELTDRVVFAATAGHVLDFDDTYLPGLAHLSAPTAPVAIVLGARRGASVGNVLEAYAAGFEAMAAVARASHPQLYHAGWHPTAVTGVVGAAVAAAHLEGLDASGTRRAQNVAVLAAGGFRAAFGSDGKSVQVGVAAAAGVQAARLASGGVQVPDGSRTGRWGFEDLFGARWADPDPGRPAVAENWIKRYPCCLQTHGAIDAALSAAERGATASGGGTVTVHPISRQAAPLDDVGTGLEAKFSIPYCAAVALLHGPPSVGTFASVEDEARRLAGRIHVEEDGSLLESEAHLRWEEPDGAVIETSTKAAVGSPDNPMNDGELREKLRSLGAEHVAGLLDDPGAHAAILLEVLG